MKNKIYLILLCTVIFLFGQEGIALITKAKGKIEYKRNSDDKVFDKINKGLPLFDQDLLVTGSDGFAKYVYLDDGSLIKVHKNAEVYVYGAIDKRSIIKQINVAEGNVKFEVARQGEGEFTVITPTSVASVKGTDFWLQTDEDDGDNFFGLSGLVNVTNIQSNEIRQLTRNMTVTSLPDGSMDIKKTNPKDFKKLQSLELDVGEIDEVEFEQSLLEQSGEELPEGEIKVQLDDGSGSLKEIIIKFK